MADFILKKGSTFRSLRTTLESSNPNDDLSGAAGATVTIINPETGVAVVSAATATITANTATSIEVKYDWQTLDVNTAGFYICYWEVTWNAPSRYDKFPADGFNTILIEGLDLSPFKVLVTEDDIKGVRSILGVTDSDLSDEDIKSPGYLQVCEAYILKKLSAQAGCPSLNQIMSVTSPAVISDKMFLKAAVQNYLCFLFTFAATNAVNTSVTSGPQTVDLGGIGSQWIQQGEKYLNQATLYLTQITGWVKWRVIP